MLNVSDQTKGVLEELHQEPTVEELMGRLRPRLQSAQDKLNAARANAEELEREVERLIFASNELLATSTEAAPEVQG